MSEHGHTHSVYTLCHECRSWGINLPDNVRCGNCQSKDTTLYRPPCCFEEIDKWKSLAGELRDTIKNLRELFNPISPTVEMINEVLSKAREAGL